MLGGSGWTLGKNKNHEEGGTALGRGMPKEMVKLPSVEVLKSLLEKAMADTVLCWS